MSNRSKKRKLCPACSINDFHHFLFQKRHWQQGYAKALREHPYMGAYIPQRTLHRELHSKVHDVPVPNGRECRLAFEELMRLERAGLIDPVNDTPMEKLDFLIFLWREFCPATVAILEWQRDIIAKFFIERSK